MSTHYLLSKICIALRRLSRGLNYNEQTNNCMRVGWRIARRINLECRVPAHERAEIMGLHVHGGNFDNPVLSSGWLSTIFAPEHIDGW